MSDKEIIFSQLQEEAISAIVNWYGDENGRQEFILHGFAGTGKSSCVAEAIKRIQEKYEIEEVVMGAYTGKAAHVLRKKGNANAQTIHSMIYTVKQDEITGELISMLNPLGSAAMAELIVLDEVSMCSEEIAKDLRSFKRKILCMGDPGQLPPVNGVGAFNGEPDFFLHEIHRQAENSPVIELATMARQGIMPPIGYKKHGVQVLPLTNATAENIFNPDTQVICGLNRIRWALTQLMRQRLGFEGHYPLPGERILCAKNNKEKGLFNGGIGTLIKLEIQAMDMKWYVPAEYEKLAPILHGVEPSWRIDAEIEGRHYSKLVIDPFLFRQHFDNGTSQRNLKKKKPNEFDWAYVLTCHKAQGSSWPHCTVVDDSTSFKEDRWKWLYTALTRSEEGLILLVKQ